MVLTLIWLVKSFSSIRLWSSLNALSSMPVMLLRSIERCVSLGRCENTPLFMSVRWFSPKLRVFREGRRAKASDSSFSIEFRARDIVSRVEELAKLKGKMALIVPYCTCRRDRHNGCELWTKIGMKHGKKGCFLISQLFFFEVQFVFFYLEGLDVW